MFHFTNCLLFYTLVEMSYQFILASGNEGKRRELEQIFSSGKMAITLPPQRIEVVESGTSFGQNALLKARAYYQKYQAPTLSDDSGLEVMALPGEMGVYSAHFGGDALSSKERAYLLLEKLKSTPLGERGACFVCQLCFYCSPGEIFFFQGRLEGEISFEARGEGGFGYDPIFIPRANSDGRTLAQIPQWKQVHGHRAKAVAQAKDFFLGRGKGKGWPEDSSLGQTIL